VSNIVGFPTIFVYCIFLETETIKTGRNLEKKKDLPSEFAI